MGRHLPKDADGKPLATHPTTAKYFPKKKAVPELPAPIQAPVVVETPEKAHRYNANITCAECDAVGHGDQFCFMTNENLLKDYTDRYPDTKAFWDRKVRKHKAAKAAAAAKTAKAAKAGPAPE